MPRVQGVKRLGITALTAAALMLGAQGAPRAAALNLSDTPLFLKAGVPPNLILTLDDSGSMDRDYIPDTLPENEDRNELYFYSAHYNGLAYDPSVTYTPPYTPTGFQSLTTSFTEAWDDGFVRGDTDDLTDEYLEIDVHLTSAHTGDDQNDKEAFYAVWDPNNSNCNKSDTDNDCYDKVTVSQTSGPNDTDERQNFANWYSFYRTRRLATITGATLAFADIDGGIRIGWQRLNDGAEVTGVRLFTGAHRDAFYTWLLNSPANGNTPLRAAMQRAGDYYSTDEPYLKNPEDSSSEMAACRQNYHILMTDGLWNGGLSGGPGNTDNESHALPDGAQYTPQAPFRDDYGDYDDDSEDANGGTLADLAFHYWLTDLRPNLDNIVPPFMPYKGGTAEENYWNPRNDPANWQHMVTYTMSLGLDNTLTDPDWGGSTFAGEYPAIAAGDEPWPEVGDNDSTNAYDLWHAAINSRGQFFSADDPKALSDAFKTILNRIADRISSGTSVAIESGAIAHSDQVYIARFNSRDWTGQVVAYKLLENGDIGAAVWDAACALNGGDCATDGIDYKSAETESSRRIVTWNPQSDKGVPFDWNSLTLSQQGALDGASDTQLGKNRLLYLRGDRANELASGGAFRNRKGLLGDVVNATPVYVGPPDWFYPDNWDDLSTNTDDTTAEDQADKTYHEFKSAHDSRLGVVYVGANDGMLHAFAAATGEELFAYVPSAVYDHLSALTEPDYGHRFYVDGTPTEGDAFFGGKWHTVLVGGLRGGGQGIYALDITDVPSTSAGETDIAAKVLWEFTDADDADLGYTYSRPQIMRLHNGTWAAVFGNGYNNTENTETDDHASTTGNAVLYVVDIADGSLIQKIDTGAGFEDDPTSQKRPNGLATVTGADIDGDLIVDYVYAGDLYGNLWKFDLRGDKPEEWSVAYGKPLFQAVRGTGNDAHYQPITTKPSIRRHPTGKGYLLLFGTGKYLETADAKAKTTVESVYGIWDRDRKDNSGKPQLDSFTRAALLEQVIKQEVTSGKRAWRVVSNNSLTWYPAEDAGVPSDPKNEGYLGWYLDLKVKDGPALGEMQVTDSLVRGNRLIFTTLIPNNDPCSLGGESWLMVLDYRDGSRFKAPVFDTNNDGVFNLADLVEVDTDYSDEGGDNDSSDDGKNEKKKRNVSGQKSDDILQTPALGARRDSDRAYLGGSDGKGTDCAGEDCTDIGRDPAARNRQSWRQLR